MLLTIISLKALQKNQVIMPKIDNPKLQPQIWARAMNKQAVPPVQVCSFSHPIPVLWFEYGYPVIKDCENIYPLGSGKENMWFFGPSLPWIQIWDPYLFVELMRKS